MEVESLKKLAYEAYVNANGLCGWQIKEGKKYNYMEMDGTLTDLEECVYRNSEYRLCHYDGPSWSESIKFANTDEDRYHIYRNSSNSYGKILPIIEQK